MTKSTTGSAGYLFSAVRATVGDAMAKWVLVALADRANDQGECWPSIETIASQCECTRRTVERKLAYLEEKGLIWRIHRSEDGMKQTNLYRLSIDTTQSRIDASQSRRGSVTESHKAPIEAPIVINREKWVEWVEHLKAKRKTPPPTTVTKQQAMLSNYDKPTQAIIIDQSIMNNWQGLFPPKERNSAENRSGRNSATHQPRLTPAQRTELKRQEAYRRESASEASDVGVVEAHGRDVRTYLG